MRKPENLERLCEELYKSPPNWESIINKFKSHPGFNPENKFSIGQYARYFSEIHLDLCLESLAERHPEMNISLNAIEEGSQSTGYVFHYDRAGRLFAYRKSDIRQRHEYDKVITVDNLPVVFEIKISRWERFGKKAKIRIRIGATEVRVSDAVKDAMREEVYSKKLFPIKEFFGSDVGYVIIIPKDIYDLRDSTHKDSVYYRFIMNNGLVVPFYATRWEYRNIDVLRVVNEYKLNLDETARSAITR